MNKVEPFLRSLFKKEGANYQSIHTFKLAHVNKMSQKTMNFLNIEQIRKYHEANSFVDALEDKPILFKDYIKHTSGDNKKAI